VFSQCCSANFFHLGLPFFFKGSKECFSKKVSGAVFATLACCRFVKVEKEKGNRRKGLLRQLGFVPLFDLFKVEDGLELTKWLVRKCYQKLAIAGPFA
jgi:hypothetical protein